jgi:dipeptidyl aminopeptidase/acylaminoacyl peptidase
MNMNTRNFVEKNIQYRSGTLMLAGVAMLPDRDLSPGVVIIHGSGNSDRRGIWYHKLARYLASRGIAVLLPDKRGCYESEGDWKKANFHDLADDSIAGVEALRAQTNVDQERVGLIGFSQGGWIAPLAAHRGHVAFVVSLSGATVTPLEAFQYEHKQDLREKGLPKTLSRISFPLAEFFLRKRWHRWSDVKDFDPIPLWERLPVPALLVFGERDQNVPVQESLRRLEGVLNKKRQNDFSVKVLHDSGHGLLEPKSQNLRQDFLHLLVEWIATR